MNPNDTPSTVGTQARSNPGDGEGWRSREGQREGLVDEAVDAARKVYHEGERYLRTAYDRLPADMDRYVSRGRALRTPTTPRPASAQASA